MRRPIRDWVRISWILSNGYILVYGVLFGVGKLLLGETWLGLGMLAAGLLVGAVIYWDLSRRGWKSVVD